MPKRYAVQAGDHISWIAEKHGFSSYHTIWDDPANTGLRAVRPNPHQLVPGDEIVIPDKTYANLPLASDREHQITVRRDVLRLRLLLADVFGLPIANASGNLEVGGSSVPVTTDGNGLLSTVIPRDAREGVLEIAGWTFRIAIGALQPKSESEGQTARLSNLGLWRGIPGDYDDPEAQSLGLELLQHRRGQVPAGAPRLAAAADDLAELHDPTT